jgi:hypothetical protein
MRWLPEILSVLAAATVGRTDQRSHRLSAGNARALASNAMVAALSFVGRRRTVH